MGRRVDVERSYRCTSGKCNKADWDREDFSEEPEEVDEYYHDLNNGLQYNELDHVPDDHEYVTVVVCEGVCCVCEEHDSKD